MKTKIAKQLRQRKHKIRKRLDKRKRPANVQTMLNPGNIHYEISDRNLGMIYGGIGAIQMLVERLKLDENINRYLHVFKLHNPYFESDHVLNIAFNILCNGQCLEDIERLRNDESYLDKAAILCRRAGFRKIRFRGDTDFSQTEYLDGWDEQDFIFVFGISAMPNLVRCQSSGTGNFGSRPFMFSPSAVQGYYSFPSIRNPSGGAKASLSHLGVFAIPMPQYQFYLPAAGRSIVLSAPIGASGAGSREKSFGQMTKLGLPGG